MKKIIFGLALAISCHFSIKATENPCKQYNSLNDCKASNETMKCQVYGNPFKACIIDCGDIKQAGSCNSAANCYWTNSTAPNANPEDGTCNYRYNTDLSTSTYTVADNGTYYNPSATLTSPLIQIP